MMALNIYNTLTRKKELFTPLVEGRVGIYVCGPTVYGHSHIGHAKSYVSFDIVNRYLRYLAYKVTYIQNITDVGHLTDDADEGEDKLVKQSRIDKLHPMALAELYTRSYFEDMDALGLLRPDISPRATGHITEQIEMVKSLLAKGCAYEVNGSVYFDVSRFPGYGRLSGRNVEDMEAGARVDVNPEKKHPADFALWKNAEPGHIMQWPSPWGMGFPGWHIECSAMSMKYLGESFDIHGGGMENQFPHHECEVAQSECSTGKPFVRYWMHNNMVTVGGQKMGKSLGNVINLKDAFKRYPPVVIRFFILQSHYRGTLDFTDGALDAAAKGFEKLRNTVRTVRDEIRRTGNEAAMIPQVPRFMQFKTAFLEAMDDDFNAPKALGVLFDLAHEMNTLLAEGRSDAAVLSEFDGLHRELGGTILGLDPDQAGGSHDTRESIEPALMQLVIDLRAEIRKQKLWALSDKIRDHLAKLGIAVEDKKEGTTWRRQG